MGAHDEKRAEAEAAAKVVPESVKRITEAAQQRVLSRKERANLEREYAYAAGCAGKADYWRSTVPHQLGAQVNSPRDGYMGGFIDREDDPICLAREMRRAPRCARVGADGGE